MCPRHKASAESWSTVLLSLGGNGQRQVKGVLERVRHLRYRRLSAQASHRDQPRPRETKGSEAKEAPLDIPPDIRLGRKMRFWGDSPQIKGKKKQKMIK